MDERKARIHLSGTTSEWFDVRRGVPQGSILGPSLYSIYTADINVPCTENSGMAQYADDYLLWCRFRHTGKISKCIASNLGTIREGMERWGIQLNLAKTQLLIVPGDTKGARKFAREVEEDGLSIQSGETIAGVKVLKYLGIQLDSELNMNKRAGEMARKGLAAYGHLKWILQKPSIKENTKRLIIQQLIRPAMLYGTETLAKADGQILNKLGVAERKILRGITKLYRQPNGKYYRNEVLYEKAGLKKRIEEVVKERMEKAYERKRTHSNEWYRGRVEMLEERRMQHKCRNIEYDRWTKEWKEMKG